jgi:hypothetical protein
VVQVAQAAAAGNGFVEHGPPGHLLDVLAEVADGEALRHRHVALVRRFLAHDHPEERGLAGAVRADEADLSPGIELKRGVDEEDLLAVLLADFGEGDQDVRFNRRTHGETEVIGAFLLQPDVARVVVGQLHDEHARLLGQRRGDLLHQLLLPLHVHRREQLVLVNRLEQRLVFASACSSASENDGMDRCRRRDRASRRSAPPDRAVPVRSASS